MTITKVEQAEREVERCLCEPQEWIGRITTSSDDGTASVWICGQSAHRSAAETWVRLLVGVEPVFVPKRAPGAR